mgnify:FL=1
MKIFWLIVLLIYLFLGFSVLNCTINIGNTQKNKASNLDIIKKYGILLQKDLKKTIFNLKRNN